MINIDEKKYVVVESFINSKNAIYMGEDFKKYCMAIKAESDPSSDNAPATYGHPLTYDLLISRIFYMNDLLGERLYPTYCYGRWYKPGSELKIHTDADPCEISVTLNLLGDPYPINFLINDNIVSVTLAPGDAVVYKGCQVPHGREPFRGRECVQAFLHYVRANGPKYFHAFDLQRKKVLGDPYKHLNRDLIT